MESKGNDGRMSQGEKAAFWLLLAATAWLMAMCFGGCAGARTVYVPVETVQRDTVRQNTHSADTLWVRDSIYVEGEKEYRERLMWRTRTLTDTLYVARTDTIRVPYPVEAVAPKSKWHDTAFKWLGQGCAIAALLWLIFLYLRRKR